MQKSTSPSHSDKNEILHEPAEQKPITFHEKQQFHGKCSK